MFLLMSHREPWNPKSILVTVACVLRGNFFDVWWISSDGQIWLDVTFLSARWIMRCVVRYHILSDNDALNVTIFVVVFWTEEAKTQLGFDNEWGRIAMEFRPQEMTCIFPQ